MGRKFDIQGVEFDIDDITEAHLAAGLTGGILTVWTTDGDEHVFQLATRDSAADFNAYAILKYESGCFTETRPRSPKPVPEQTAQPAWHRTGNARFPVAARVDGHWWVLRANNFPDHPMWTLFVDGRPRYDVDDTPPAWGKPAATTVSLTPQEASEALAPAHTFVAYGSEVGRACEYDCCD